jgi:glycine/D-amino acid oxidase-like deaminating enzyme
MKQLSYWLDTYYEPRRPLITDIQSDVAVIGGGITGVSAAYHCAKAGLKTVLIEKETIASNSAGKNGGMVVEGLAIDFTEAVEQFGKETACETWQRTVDSREHVASLITEHSIECNFSRSGSLYMAENENLSVLEEEFKQRRTNGFESQLLDDEMNSQALFVSKDCMLHPVKFVRGLADAAVGFGAVLYENTPMISLSKNRIVTPKGTIEADKILLALESGKQDLAEEEGMIISELAFVTEPLAEADWMHLDWHHGGMFWTTGEHYLTARKIGARLFLNGAISLDPSQEVIQQTAGDLIKRFLNRFPDIERSTIVPSHVWTGRLLYPKRNLPHIRVTERGYELFGNGGNGLTNGIMLGRLAAESLLGTPIPAIYRSNS